MRIPSTSDSTSLLVCLSHSSLLTANLWLTAISTLWTAWNWQFYDLAYINLQPVISTFQPNGTWSQKFFFIYSISFQLFLDSGWLLWRSYFESLLLVIKHQTLQTQKTSFTVHFTISVSWSESDPRLWTYWWIQCHTPASVSYTSWKRNNNFYLVSIL